MHAAATVPAGDSQRPSPFALGLGVAAAVATAFGGSTLAREPLWNDELASLSIVDRSFGDLLGVFPEEHNGVLFHLALWPIVHLGGTSEPWLRLPALIAFVLAVIVSGLVGRRLGGSAVGLSAAVLLAVNPFAVRYAQEARMYGFALLFTVVAVWLLLRAVERPTRIRWLLYASCVAAIGYSHDLALLGVLAHPLLVPWGQRPTRRGFVAALGAAALFLVPLAVLAAQDLSSDPLFWVDRPGPGVARTFALTATGSWLALGVCAVVVATAAAALAWRDCKAPSPAVVTFLMAWLLAPFVALFLVSQVKPLLVLRYLVPSVPALCLLLAISLTLLAPPVAAVAGVMVATSFGAYALKADLSLTNPDFPGVASYLDASRHQEDLVVTVADAKQVANALFYYGRRGTIDREHLLWTDEDVERLPPSVRLLGLRPPSRVTTDDVKKLVAPRRLTWVVISGYAAPSGLTPIHQWAARCGGRPRAFRRVDLLVLHACTPSHG